MGSENDLRDQLDVTAELRQRIARLETILKEMGKLAMDDDMSDRGFRRYVHNEVGFALEVRDGAGGAE